MGIGTGTTLTSKPNTLGEVLSRDSTSGRHLTYVGWLKNALQRLLYSSLLACVSALTLWWFLERPNVDAGPALILLSALIIFWWLVDRKFRGSKRHFLLANDRQGFMHSLRLDKKTAVFDGSNIYHLGHDTKLDAQPLGEIVHLLRSQGYRIICFFDANIFHTLSEHGAFHRDKRHSLTMLEHIFGLKEDEIYVVPSGVQADKCILECLKYLPISFAVTNDKFRDYATQYPTVMKDNLWRKGVVVSGNEVRLLHH